MQETVLTLSSRKCQSHCERIVFCLVFLSFCLSLSFRLTVCLSFFFSSVFPSPVCLQLSLYRQQPQDKSNCLPAVSVNERRQQQQQKQSKTEKTRRAKHSLTEASPSDVITFSRGRIYYTLYRRAQMVRTVMILLKKRDHVRFICCAVLRID